MLRVKSVILFSPTFKFGKSNIERKERISCKIITERLGKIREIKGERAREKWDVEELEKG